MAASPRYTKLRPSSGCPTSFQKPRSFRWRSSRSASVGTQLQGQLYISQRSWVDILCWHDVLPKLVMRVDPDEKFIKALDRELRIFNYFIEGVMEKIRTTGELPIPPSRLALKAALRASLEITP